jgi:hypothetical protein
MGATLPPSSTGQPIAGADAGRCTTPSAELELIEQLVEEGKLDPGSHLNAVRRRIEAAERKVLPPTMDRS